LGVLKHIVIVYPKDFPLSVWQRISLFESVWIIRGSALEEADIRRAGIFKAKQVKNAYSLNVNALFDLNMGRRW
jgi:hypothetical protein